ncbi:MAG TPA: ribosome silencing factor [Stellaceae bacterium]|nr:ribosome silencing factor [Stellaceae bacterium]
MSKVLEDGKAENLVVIDLQGKTNIADHLVIASGRSQRQVLALAEHVLAALKSAGHGRASAEGLPHGDWVLIDAGDVVVHLFRPEVRSYYNLEKMWGATLGEAAGAS